MIEDFAVTGYGQAFKTTLVLAAGNGVNGDHDFIRVVDGWEVGAEAEAAVAMWDVGQRSIIACRNLLDVGTGKYKGCIRRKPRSHHRRPRQDIHCRWRRVCLVDLRCQTHHRCMSLLEG